MPPIRNVDGIGCSAPTAVGVAGATVAGDHLDAGVGAQPRCKAIRLAVRQQVNDGTAFQVNENRAVALPAFPGSVVHPEHAWRRGRHRRRPTTDEAEQGGPAHGRADPFGQARAGLATQCQADVALEAAQACCPLGMRPGSSRQAFGEDAVGAARSSAAKPAHLHLDLHATTLPGQVRQPAGVAAVPPR